jgi:hypothetical protein
VRRLRLPLPRHHGAMPDELHTRTISLVTAYGEEVASEQVAPSEFPCALRRIYNRALQCANAVVVLDGVTQSRSTFLAFVREFNEAAARGAQARPA